MGFRGDPVRTPAMDRLAAEGTSYSRAYTPCPICVPARASLATGRYVHQIGYWDNSFGYDGRVPSWHHLLRRSGVRVESIGKLHFRASGEDHGFSVEHVPLQIVGGVGDLLSCIRQDAPIRHKRSGIEEAGGGESSYMRYDTEIADRAVEWIGDRAGSDEPWALFVGFVQPHPPYIARPTLVEHYLQTGFPMPPGWREWPSHPAMEEFRRFFDFDTPFPPSVVRRLGAAYRGACTQLDEEISKIIGALDESGEADSTLVVYTSDHGESLGARGIFGKFTMYDESARVPLILRGPGVSAARDVSTPASLVDLYPTIAAHFGLASGGDLPGRSLFDLDDHDQRMVFSEYHAVGSTNACYMVTDGRFKYVHYVGAPPMLYDLVADPNEFDDLSSEADHEGEMRRLRGALFDIVDPESIDVRAKQAQAAQIARHGGRDAVIARGAFDNSPVPGEEADFH